ncbi:hypothetical protein GCM10023334_114180 [Nonomuraea thailandensis]
MPTPGRSIGTGGVTTALAHLGAAEDLAHNHGHARLQPPIGCMGLDILAEPGMTLDVLACPACVIRGTAVRAGEAASLAAAIKYVTSSDGVLIPWDCEQPYESPARLLAI